LQNIYPEVAVALGVPLLKGPILRALCALRDRSLKVASANVVLSLAMAGKVLARGTSPDHIYMIPNWSDDDAISPVAPATILCANNGSSRTSLLSAIPAISVAPTIAIPSWPLPNGFMP
jgi:hypothetical protein